MNILAIGSMPSDLELTCFGILSKCNRDGHESYVIIPEDIYEWPERWRKTLIDSCKKINISQVHFTERFDYSGVTQDNVDVLSSFIKTIKPSLVFMPFWKSHNEKRKILARTSLIACRGIGNILMYELEENKSFVPTVCFKTSEHDSQLKASCFDAYDTILVEQKFSQKAASLPIKKSELSTQSSHIYSILEPSAAIEMFESHRMLLVDNEGF
jgi:hypothetical protein